MNPETEQSEKKMNSAEKPSARDAWKLLREYLRAMIAHNLPWKLLAAFLAICLWAGLITQDPTLTRERIFNDVQVSLQGGDTLRRNGFILLSDFEDSSLNVRLRADVPQREYNTVAATNYNPRIDLTKITETGPQNLKIITTSSNTYGTVQEVSPDTISVVVDEYTTKYRVPVTLERSQQFPTGFYGTTPALDPPSVVVSGPKSVVDSISRVVVDFDQSALPAQSGIARRALPLRFVDSNNEPVDSHLIEVTSAGVLLRSIIVEQPLYPTKTLPISSLSLITGEPAAGYEVKSITATPNVVVAAGEEIGLGALDTLFLEKDIDVSGQTESFSAEVVIRQPSELVYLSSRSIMLSVEIGPIIVTQNFDKINLQVQNAARSLPVIHAVKDVSLTLTGPSLLVGNLKASAITAYVDVADLEPGSYELPILLDIKNQENQTFIYDISPKTVQLQIEQR